MMERTDAYRTLRLHDSADGQMVQNAYWMLVRRARDRGSRDLDARTEIERLNEAYAVLSPNGKRPEAPRPIRAPGAAPEGTEFIDRAVDWLSEQALRTRERWQDRNPEIAIIGGAALFLAFVALAEGASFWIVLLCAVLIGGAIWSPWRK